jgi:hypothetical protein
MGKTNPLNDADLSEFIELQKTKADSPKSWSVDVAAIDAKTFDLSVKNPNPSFLFLRFDDCCCGSLVGILAICTNALSSHLLVHRAVPRLSFG